MYNAHIIDWLSAKVHHGKSLCQIANHYRAMFGLPPSWY